MTETHAPEAGLRCPQCRLFNPAGASFCDSGYNFRNGNVDPERAQAAGPKGVGGWLALLVVGLTALGPLSRAGRTYVDFLSAESNFPAVTRSAEGSNPKIATWSVFLCFAAIEMEESFINPFVMSVVYAFVWTTYLALSKRVRATYAKTATGPGG